MPIKHFRLSVTFIGSIKHFKNVDVLDYFIIFRVINYIGITFVFSSETPVTSSWPSELKLQRIENNKGNKYSESDEEFDDDDNEDDEYYDDDDDWDYDDYEDEEEDWLDDDDEDEYDDEYYDDETVRFGFGSAQVCSWSPSSL